MRTSTVELMEAAEELGFCIQHDCGGYRVTEAQGGGYRYIFPDGGVCPTATKSECMIFLHGVKYERKK